jgi:dihydrofolate reductase
MGTITVFNSITLDGVMQAPARLDEDTRGGFEHGGWAVAAGDPVIASVAAQGMSRPVEGGLLLGRRTYENLYSVWPKRTNNPFTSALNATQKYVASRTLKEPLPWENSTLLEGEVTEAVAALKEGDRHFTILGSGELIRALMPKRLIDRFILMIHPVVLGKGLRMFGDEGGVTALKLVDSKVSTTGVLIGTYELYGR